MLSLDARIKEAIAWLQLEALRQVTIAQQNVAQGETAEARGLPIRAEAYRRCAADAARQGETYIGWAMALATLRPLGADLTPGATTYLPATFLRRASAEDFPGEAFFRLAGGDVVRAPLAPFDRAQVTGIAPIRQAPDRIGAQA